MSDLSSDDESHVLSTRNMARISDEIKKKKKDPATRGMFVSGWDDPEIDEDINEEKHPHETPEKEILWAAENGKIEIVKSLLVNNSELVKVTDNDNYTPLHRACYNDHNEVVDLLLSYGACVSAKTKMGWEPLHSACHWNHPNCISRLFAAGANVNARSEGNQTPLHVATSISHCKQMLHLLLLHPDIDPFVKNKSGDYPKDIARRTGIYDYLFDIAEPAINYIKSQAFTVNPFMRD